MNAQDIKRQKSKQTKEELLIKNLLPLLKEILIKKHKEKAKIKRA